MQQLAFLATCNAEDLGHDPKVIELDGHWKAVQQWARMLQEKLQQEKLKNVAREATARLLQEKVPHTRQPKDSQKRQPEHPPKEPKRSKRQADPSEQPRSAANNRQPTKKRQPAADDRPNARQPAKQPPSGKPSSSEPNADKEHPHGKRKRLLTWGGHDINMEGLAEELNMTPTQLRSVLQKHTGLSSTPSPASARACGAPAEARAVPKQAKAEPVQVTKQAKAQPVQVTKTTTMAALKKWTKQHATRGLQERWPTLTSNQKNALKTKVNDPPLGFKDKLTDSIDAVHVLFAALHQGTITCQPGESAWRNMYKSIYQTLNTKREDSDELTNPTLLKAMGNVGYLI